jgi:peptidoglycan-N-acetylglucosamine deacetylase
MIASPVPWTNGAKCACCLSFDMDADSLIHIEYPDDGNRRVSAISMLRYGPDVAVPPIVDTYKRLGLQQTFFVPAWCIEQYPKAIEKILEGGNEHAHHGYIHENPVEQTREGEAHWLDVGIEIIARVSEKKPRGWRAPLYNYSPNSIDLLTERGFACDSLMGDDVTYVIESRESGKRLIELPSHWGLDD